MAKIKKMTFETGKMPEVSTNSLLEDVNAEIEQKEKKNLTAEVVDIKTKVIDKDIQAKLDSCAQIEAQNAFLLKEKAELEARLAEYIEENASLKNASKTTEAGNENELANLKKEISQSPSKAHSLLGEIVKADGNYYPALYELACDYYEGPSLTGGEARNLRYAKDLLDKAYKYASEAEDPVYVNKISALLRKY